MSSLGYDTVISPKRIKMCRAGNVSLLKLKNYKKYLGASVYYVDHDHPGGLSKYNEIILSYASTVYARFKHVRRTFLGRPFTHCTESDKTAKVSYTEHGCLMNVLMDELCKKCGCYLPYIRPMVNRADVVNCRSVLIFC